ncbi:MAG: transglycosylase domain-containing protein [Caldilineaceae bacterium]
MEAPGPSYHSKSSTATAAAQTIDPNTGKQINLDLTQIPPACVNAVVATEDARFFYHPGVDPIAVARAAWQYVAAGGRDHQRRQHYYATTGS